MTDIDTLESRIAMALDRIRRGIEAVDAQASAEAAKGRAGGEAVAALEARLDEEKTVNAQLEERVKLLKERQDGKLSVLETQLEKQRGRMVALDQELQRLRQVNAGLRASNDGLREALLREVASPELINEAMQAEIDALRAARAADEAEMNAIMGELRPLVEERR